MESCLVRDGDLSRGLGVLGKGEEFLDFEIGERERGRVECEGFVLGRLEGLFEILEV